VDALAGTIARSYDGLDRLTGEQSPQGDVTYSYDNANRRTSMTVAGQPAVNYSWDNANRLTQITQNGNTVGFVYDNASRRTTLTLPNGVTVAYTYDNDSRVSGITYTAGSTQLGNLSYTYDADGRRTAAGGSLAAVNLPAAVSSNTFNADNGMTGFNGTTLSYDANGNLTGDGTNTYTWDARNHLSAMSGAASASFVYDAFGRRARKTINGVTTQFLYDGLNPVQELNGASPPAATANLLTGLGIDQYFARTDSSGTMAFLRDALGSTVALVNSTGSIGTSYTYEPFGNTTISGSNGNPYQFTGRENDATGLYFYRARYYSPTLQRFISQDPIGFAGGDANLYAFVENNPTTLIDRIGLQVAPPYANPGSPYYNPGLAQTLSDLEDNPGQVSPINPNIPTGEPAMSCAPPPPPPPPACASGATPPEQLDPVGILTGLGGYFGYVAGGAVGAQVGGEWGALGGPAGAVVGGGLGFVAGMWTWNQQLNSCP
jgi:RHS repeat-associated protein